MTLRRPFDPTSILGVLAEHRVALVLVGGYACAFHEVGNTTADLDIVIEPSRANAEALVAALLAMNATHARLPGSQQIIRPSVERVITLTGFHHYDTDFGRIDVCKDSGGHAYESLQKGAVGVTIHEHLFFVAKLTTIAAMKEEAGREKDKAVLPAIRRRIAEVRRLGETD
jgi:hypothetical protein